ncbi:AAA domain-containing protein [Mycena floridula]|nr:AAA domain-containing protein [Mycena floridula]
MSPPLLGDGQGRYRIHITGNSGSGKTTLGRTLADLLNVPHISLDSLYWKPGWQTSSTDEFREKVQKAMTESDRGWVIDGDYQRKLGGPIVTEGATDIVWLDPPLILYFPRILIRTFRRLFGIEETCSPECPETVREVFFSKESILWWCLSQHWVNRRRGWAAMQIYGLGSGSEVSQRKMRRFGGWGGSLNIWLNQVQEMVRRG